MKISREGLARIESHIEGILEKLNRYAGMTKLDSRQREDFRDLQEQLRTAQRQRRAFGDSDAGK